MGESTTARRADALGTDSVFRLILEYSLPAIAMMLVSSLYNIVDKAFVGRFVGQVGITATTVVAPVSRVIDAFALLMGAGGSTILAIKLGEKKSDEAETILGNTVLMIFILSAALMAAGYCFMQPLLRLFGTSAETMPYAQSYLRILLLGVFFVSITNGVGLFIRVDGCPRRMMLCSVTGCILNIILDPIAIYVLNLGVAGAAAATAFSQLVSGLLVLHFFTLSRRSTIKLRLSHLRVRRRLTLQTATYGFSSFAQQVSGSITQTMILSSLAAWATSETVSGDVAQASVGITISIGLFFLLPALGISQAIGPIIGYNYGAKNYRRVVRTLWTGTALAMVMLTAGWVVILLFATPLCRIFGATDNYLAHAAYTMRVYNLLLPLVPVSYIGAGFFQSIGRPKHAVFVSLSRQILCLVPLILLLPRFFGQNGVLFSIPVADLISSALSLVLLLTACRQLNALASAETDPGPQAQDAGQKNATRPAANHLDSADGGPS